MGGGASLSPQIEYPAYGMSPRGVDESLDPNNGTFRVRSGLGAWTLQIPSNVGAGSVIPQYFYTFPMLNTKISSISLTFKFWQGVFLTTPIHLLLELNSSGGSSTLFLASATVAAPTQFTATFNTSHPFIAAANIGDILRIRCDLYSNTIACLSELNVAIAPLTPGPAVRFPFEEFVYGPSGQDGAQLSVLEVKSYRNWYFTAERASIVGWVQTPALTIKPSYLEISFELTIKRNSNLPTTILPRITFFLHLLRHRQSITCYPIADINKLEPDLPTVVHFLIDPKSSLSIGSSLSLLTLLKPGDQYQIDRRIIGSGYTIELKYFTMKVVTKYVSSMMCNNVQHMSNLMALPFPVNSNGITNGVTGIISSRGNPMVNMGPSTYTSFLVNNKWSNQPIRNDTYYTYQSPPFWYEGSGPIPISQPAMVNPANVPTTPHSVTISGVSSKSVQGNNVVGGSGKGTIEATTRHIHVDEAETGRKEIATVATPVAVAVIEDHHHYQNPNPSSIPQVTTAMGEVSRDAEGGMNDSVRDRQIYFASTNHESISGGMGLEDGWGWGNGNYE